MPPVLSLTADIALHSGSNTAFHAGNGADTGLRTGTSCGTGARTGTFTGAVIGKLASYFTAAAQNNQELPEDHMQRIREELERRDISETELRTRLLQEGINIDTMSAAEVRDHEDEIRAVIREIEEEREEEEDQFEEEREAERERIESEPQPDRPSEADQRILRLQQDMRGYEGVRELEEAYREVVYSMTAQDVDSIYREIRERQIYGHTLFIEDILEVFQTTDGARAPDSYVLGPGDVIRASIFGTSQADIQLEINDEGYVRPDGMPMIFLHGLSIAEARRVLRERFSNFYTFQDDQFALIIESARTITVNVFGEANLRGSFNVSALNTGFNALAAAGGPTEMGSVRDIRLIRGDERKRMDVYEFMDDPSVQFDFDLRHNDIIYVPVSEKLVRISGAVRRPMRYELREEETLRDLIRFAGGVNYDAAGDFVQIERVEDGDRVLNEWHLQDVLDGNVEVPMKDGDRVRVRELGRELDRFVEVSGSVYYPGRYDLTDSPDLEQLLERAQVREQAKTDLIFVERTLQDESVRIIPVEWDSLSRTDQTFSLDQRDRVIVFDQERYRSIATIGVAGDVRRPFSRAMTYDERLTIGDAIEYAGGLRPTAADIGYIHRRDLFNREQVDHIAVDLTRDLDLELRPGDQLNVYDQSTYSDIGEITIHGMVNDPFRTKYEPDLTVNDMLKMAGGFQRGAALDRIDIFRLNLSIEEGTSYEVISLEADSTMQIVDAPEGFRLQPFDEVVVRRIPQFQIGHSVEIEGEVMYPGIYPLESRRTHLSDVIEESGGVTGVADRQNAVILRSFRGMGRIGVNLRDAMRNQGDERYDPVVFDDDIITIPRFQNTVTIRAIGTRYGELQQYGVALLPPGEAYEGQVYERVRELDDREREGYSRYDLEREAEKRQNRFDEQRPINKQIDISDIGRLSPLSDPTEAQPGLADMQSINVPFQGRRSASWYIENYAGGFAEEADKRSVTVTTASGQIRGTRRRFFFFNNYPDVEPGSTIALRNEPPPDPEEETGIDVERALDRTMQLTTSLLTIMVLIDRLDR